MTRDEVLRLLDTVPGIVVKRDHVLYRKNERGYQDGWLRGDPGWSTVRPLSFMQVHEDGYEVHSRPDVAAPTTSAAIEPTEADIARALDALDVTCGSRVVRDVAVAIAATREQTAREITEWLLTPEARKASGASAHKFLVAAIESKWGKPT